MIDWTTIRPALETLFAGLSGLRAVWVDKRRPYIDPSAQAVVLLRVRTEDGVGVDDARTVDLELDIPNATLEEQINGIRRVSFDVRVESFRHDDDRFAFNAASKIRSGLRFSSSLAALRDVGVALVRVGQALDVSGIVQDDRTTSIAVLDVIFSVAVCTADTANRIQTIETVDNPFDHVDTVIAPPC